MFEKFYPIQITMLPSIYNGSKKGVGFFFCREKERSKRRVQNII